MRILMAIGFYFISIVSIGQNIYSPTNGYVTLGDPLEKVLGVFEAKTEKKGCYGCYYNRQVGYAFGLDTSNRLAWFSTNNNGVIIGDGSIKCGMSVKDIKLVTTKQQVKKVRLFNNLYSVKSLFISGLDKFPDTEFIVDFKDRSLVKKLQEASDSPWRNDNGFYNVPIDLIPDDLKISSIRVTKSKI